ncbi:MULTISPECIES: ABC transporter substrate-binding protein [Caldisericum]|jgi:putative spermidine/putrescine transport system substrate-binding protein|uniref:ABC transporter substrate-binding protein n=1 Tax=Caldisericum exile TaxID=693075 RepID=A0A2J6WFG3_9BACT|nr:MAG: hypothetical protein C0189_01235 [Caldisericum exile]
MKKLLAFLVVAVLLSLLLTGCKTSTTTTTQTGKSVMEELANAAKGEGGVINSYGMPDVWANYGEIFGEFEKLYGIKHQDIDMGSSVVYSRMKEENASKNDIADLKPSYAMKLANEGYTSDYKVSVWDKIPEGQKGVASNGSVWQAAYKGTLGFIVNTNIVKKVPHTWAELNDPQYKGLVSYLDPRATGTGVNTVEAISYAMSGDPYNYKAGIDFLVKLHKNGIIASVDPKVDVSKFQRGEVAILINFDYNLLLWRDTLGVPAEVVIPTDGTIAVGGGVIMAKNAPHPNTAKLFLEFLFSEKGQQLFAKAYVTPIRPDVQIPPEIASKFPPKEEYSKVAFIDYTKDGEISQALQNAWAQAVGAK